MRCFGPNYVSFFYLQVLAKLIAASDMIIDILFFHCSFVDMLNYIDMTRYSLCRHKCRQTLCRRQHYFLHPPAGPGNFMNLQDPISEFCLVLKTLHMYSLSTFFLNHKLLEILSSKQSPNNTGWFRRSGISRVYLCAWLSLQLTASNKSYIDLMD